jgi:hypothetical protein
MAMSPQEVDKAKRSLAGIPGVEDSEVDALAAAGLHGREELWKPIENNQPGGLQQLSTRSGIALDRLAELLAADVLDQSATRGAWLTAHIPDLVVAGALAALVFGLFFWGLFFWRTEPPPASGPHVVAQRALAAFHTLAADDLRPAGVPASRASKMVEELAGRYTKQPVAKGATVSGSLLGPAGVRLDDSRILQVTLKQAPAAKGREAPYKASLLVSSRAPGGGIVLADVLVLAVDDAGLGVTLALPQNDVEQLGKFLGVADLYLAIRAP